MDWIASEWGESKKYLAQERATWQRRSAAMGLVFRDARDRHALA